MLPMEVCSLEDTLIFMVSVLLGYCSLTMTLMVDEQGGEEVAQKLPVRDLS